MDAVRDDLTDQLSKLNHQLAYLVDKQRARDELIDEMQPILKEVMAHTTDRFGNLEKRGYFTFAREMLRVLDRVVEGYDEEDIRALGDNVVHIVDTVRAYTQPQMLALANEATDAIDNADKLPPAGIVGMVRASRDEDVQRGMAVFLNVLRGVGRAVKETSSEDKPKRRRAELPAKSAAPKKQKKKTRAAKKAAPVHIAGVPFDNDGYLADADQWTEELADAVAASYGVALGERHWVAIRAARQEFLEQGVSPNIRKLTTISDVTTKELYKLFPRAPGMTVARIAGTPKPVGCI